MSFTRYFFGLFLSTLFFLTSCKVDTAARVVEPQISNFDPHCCFVEKRTTAEIEKESEGFDKIRLSLVIDDSFSMVQEIGWVKDALLNLSSLIKDSKLNVEIEFYRISEIHSNYDQTPVGGGLSHFVYKMPLPTATVKFNDQKTLDELKKEISDSLNNFDATEGIGAEEGLCYVTRIVNEIKQNANANEKVVAVVITDEDEQNGNNSFQCWKESIGPVPEVTVEPTPFVDNNDNRTFDTIIRDYLLDAQVRDKKSFAFVGIIYDENNNDCGVQEDGQHGENYLRLYNELSSVDIDATIGDVCSKSYTKMFKEKIIINYITKVHFEYVLKDITSRPVIKQVRFVSSTGDKTIVDKNDYEFDFVNGKYQITFSKDLVDALIENVMIEVIYDKRVSDDTHSLY
ncbi:MAG: hypothetical protein H6621_01785 [Halobacteriovoraceae bacterium]|nr:hypothetical protein [Halobacteriovoraceae bacterium]MCB9093773.1 hypothetical protein [Halobacteriovoraceae bacterium]